MLKRIIILGLAVLLVIATVVQVKEIVQAYQIAYEEELVPNATRVRSLTDTSMLEKVGRVTGEGTMTEGLYGYQNIVDDNLVSVIVVDRKLGLTNKASDAYYEILPGREATEEEQELFADMVSDYDEEQIYAQVISTHEASYVSNNTKSLTFYKMFLRDVDQNEYVLFLTEDGMELDFHTRGFKPLRYF